MNGPQHVFMAVLSLVAIFGFFAGVENDLQKGIVACCGVIPFVMLILGKV